MQAQSRVVRRNKGIVSVVLHNEFLGISRRDQSVGVAHVVVICIWILYDTDATAKIESGSDVYH